MIYIALTVALIVSVQDTPPAAARPDPDLIAAKLTGEPDPCARREMIINQQVAEMAGRFEDPAPEDVAEFRRIASDMYQASHDMSRPQGVLPIDFATACPAMPAPAPQRTDAAME